MHDAGGDQHGIAGLHVDHRPLGPAELEPRRTARAAHDLVGDGVVVVKGKGIAAKAVAPAVGVEMPLDRSLRLVAADIDGAPIDDERQRPVVGAGAGFLQQMMLECQRAHHAPPWPWNSWGRQKPGWSALSIERAGTLTREVYRE